MTRTTTSDTEVVHPDLNAFTLDFIGEFMGFIDECLDSESDPMVERHGWLTGEMRVWHHDGWSPGYFTNKGEDSWVFKPSYLDGDGTSLTS